MKIHMRPIFPIVVVYIAGIFLAVEFAPVWGLYTVLGLLCVACILPARIISRPLAFLFAAILLIGFSRTGILMDVAENDISRLGAGSRVKLTGRIVSEPDVSDTSARFVMVVDQAELPTGKVLACGRVMVSVYAHSRYGRVFTLPDYGDTVRVSGVLRLPDNASNPGGFDYARYLARRQVYCLISTVPNAMMICEPDTWSIHRLAWMFKRRLNDVADRIMPPPHSALVLGIVLGGRSGLPDDIQRSFVRTGTMHILAASGYNCGIVVAIFGFLMLKATVPRAWRHVILILLLWMFVLVAGASPSVVRAGIMLSVYLGAYVLRRVSDLLNIILLSALVILSINPLNLYDTGFQLSFAAVLAIVLAMPLVEQLNWWHALRTKDNKHGIRRVSRWLLQMISDAAVISVVVSLGTWPITAYYFNSISTISIVSNILMATAVGILTVSGLASLAIGVVSTTIGRCAAFPVVLVSRSMLGAIGWMASHSWAYISIPSPSPLFITIYYTLLLGALEYGHRKLDKEKRAGSARNTDCAGRTDMVSGSQA